MVLTDAMALVVCVSFDCPYGPGDIITDEVDGKLIKPDDLEGFAEALVELMNSTERRVELGQKARKKAAAYHPEMIVNQWNQLFQSLLQ
jgi:glycosyltransferase involved in cell wall biosynthesis